MSTYRISIAVAALGLLVASSASAQRLHRLAPPQRIYVNMMRNAINMKRQNRASKVAVRELAGQGRNLVKGSMVRSPISKHYRYQLGLLAEATGRVSIAGNLQRRTSPLASTLRFTNNHDRQFVGTSKSGILVPQGERTRLIAPFAIRTTLHLPGGVESTVQSKIVAPPAPPPDAIR